MRVCGNIYKSNYLLPEGYFGQIPLALMDILFSYAMYPNPNARLRVAKMQYEFFFIYYMTLCRCNLL